MKDHRRLTPRTDHLLADPRIEAAARRLGATITKREIAAAQDRCRAGDLEPEDVTEAVLAGLPATATTMRPVINATGVVVHTNFGRAPLSSAAVDALQVAAGTTDVEFDLDSGGRGQRGRGAMAALAEAVPAAGAVHVVNNGAAALALAARALAADRRIVVARGEMVEIGDGFRIPELLESVGAVIREVGTTNRVRLDDYAKAIDDETGFVLKVHPSNFVVEGFTSSVLLAELATLPVPVVADIGSGLLTPHPRLPDEPNASASLRAGAALVTASGDKLLGGPQCGLLLGTSDVVQRLRRHPFARAVRVDKLTLAALEATLTGPPPPVVRAVDAQPDELLHRARVICRRLDDITDARPVPSTAAVGGGGAPGVDLGSAAVSLPPEMAAQLRSGEPAVVGHVVQGRLLLDLVAVPAEYDGVLIDAVRRVVKEREVLT